MADESNVSPPPTPPTPLPPSPPPSPPVPPSVPKVETVTISATDYQELMTGRSRLSQLEEQQRRLQEEGQRKELQAQIEKGELTKVLESLRQQSQAQIDAEKEKARAIEQRALRGAIDGELARALAAQPLADPDAAEHLSRLIRPDLTATAQGEGYAVHTINGYQPVAEYVAALLAKPAYSRYVRARTSGGTGGQATQTPPGNNAGDQSAEQQFANWLMTKPAATDGEKIIKLAELGLYAGAKAATHEEASMDMSKTFGIRRRSG